MATGSSGSSRALILLFFLWFGQLFLTRLNIDPAIFKIGGGILLLQFGFNMMKGTTVDIDTDDKGFSAAIQKLFEQQEQINFHQNRMGAPAEENGSCSQFHY